MDKFWDDIKGFYDKWGVKQECTGAYSSFAQGFLLDNIEFTKLKAVIELGPGTGAFADKLLHSKLNLDVTYRALDLSDEMVRLSSERLKKYGERVSVEKQNIFSLNEDDYKKIDLFVSNFVLDIFPEEEIKTLLKRLTDNMAPGSQIALSSLDWGKSILGKAKAIFWYTLYKISPLKMGGCRPLSLEEMLDPNDWEIVHFKIFDTKDWSSSSLVALRKPVP